MADLEIWHVIGNLLKRRGKEDKTPPPPQGESAEGLGRAPLGVAPLGR